MSTNPIRMDTPSQMPYGYEHDACALIMSVRKRGESTYGTLKRAIGALGHMGHRTGFVDGEGDGAGVQTDIPRRLWAKALSQVGLRAALATDPGFWVGHLFIPRQIDANTARDLISDHFNQAGLNLLIERPGRVNLQALGRHARDEAPSFWQLAGHANIPDLEERLFTVRNELEDMLQIHFASLSSSTVVYKARGSVEMLAQFYPDLQDRDYHTAMVLCHARYSTNTVSSFERVQPFAMLGHNGEINTISRFRQEAQQIGARMAPGNSDSQDVDHLLNELCVTYDLDPIEAMETIFPPTPHELATLPPALRAVYRRTRHAFGPYAQGPAAIVARHGDMAVGSVDALGLRPLWLIETEKEFFLSSERGVLPLETMVADSRALAPGEKIALNVHRGETVDILDHAAIRRHVMNQAFQREAPEFAERYWAGWERAQPVNWSSSSLAASFSALAAGQVNLAPVETETTNDENQAVPAEFPWQQSESLRGIDTTVLAAAGWNRDHIQDIDTIADTSKDPVGSLGHDGPLAVLSDERVNVADYYKETVAVVTNPAIDRERETEVFSTESLVGARPIIGQPPRPTDTLVELSTPILAGGHPILGGDDIAEQTAAAVGGLTLDQLVAQFGERVAWLTIGVSANENVSQALQRLANGAIEAVNAGAQCIVLDDTEMLDLNLNWLDPHLATSVIDNALRNFSASINLRRRTGLIVRSVSIRTLHDVAVLLGLGADAVNPYGMLAVALGANKPKTAIEDEQEIIQRQIRILQSLTNGLEKVISTIGCHELRGYGRVFSAIGIAPSIADTMGTPYYFGSERTGLNWAHLDRESAVRGAELRGESRAKLARVDRLYPKFWKKAQALASGEISADEYIEIYDDLTEKLPIALRHLLGIHQRDTDIDPALVDISIDDYDLPVLISAMSFGSQGELAYRAYADAAVNLNILCINGEGGELPDMLAGSHKRNRGQQVASGRFGVNAQFLNSCAIIEIKVGQGAKPGEGGMLPAYKVTPQVAQARNTNPFVPLISPSNNHDIYSIEDLAQLIEELKTVNPEAKVSVKIPVVPGVGVIAVGVAKAGADVINLTGYDGGTGAARRHSLQYAGLPTEIGVIQAHRALVDSGLRHRVELWCDGGMKTGSDAFKMILLGANRVGFATMAMVAMGCTICRKCNEGTCHVGITTHIKTVEEATELGLKSFEPRDAQCAVEGIERVFHAIGEELRRLTASVGATRLQDLVGRAELLDQVRSHDRIDLSSMIAYVPVKSRPPSEIGIGRRLTRPRNTLTKMLTDVVVAALEDGESEVTYQDDVMARDRALGSHLAGELVRRADLRDITNTIHLRFGPSSLAGNGLAAWTVAPLDILLEGGAQDGAAKGGNGGRIAIMKGVNHNGVRLDGSVGKSFAYGAQRGVFIVQGDADSRACIRLSGADVIFGGELRQPIDDSAGVSGTHANLKGFACEYMTSGRVVILGDPGPFAFAGMTGGVVYQQIVPELGLDRAAIHRRIGLGANVLIETLEHDDVNQLQELLDHYIAALDQTSQYDLADRMRVLQREDELLKRFVKVVPEYVPKTLATASDTTASETTEPAMVTTTTAY